MAETKRVLYPALVHREDDGQVSIAFPDLEGCFASGDDFEEAYFKAQKALAIYATYMNNLKRPSEITAIKTNETNTEIILIGVDPKYFETKSTESIKKTLSIPKWINDIAFQHNTNFSAVLKNALIEHLLGREDLNEIERNMLRGEKESM